MTVDTRTVDVNVDRFDARYDDWLPPRTPRTAASPPQGQQAEVHPARPAPAPARSRRAKRETEFESLQRIQLEKGPQRTALKVMIPDEITVGELAKRT